MGGNVGVTIKFNQQLKKMVKTTGSYKFLFFSQNMLNQQYEQAIKDYSKYGLFEQMIPVDYGLIFIDFDTKEIHSMQGYDTPASFSTFDLKYNISQKNLPSSLHLSEFIQKDLVHIEINNKNFSLQQFFDTKNPAKIVQITYSPNHFFNFNIRKLVKKHQLSKEEKKSLFFLNFYLNDWKIIKYQENIQGLIDFFHFLQPLLDNKEIQEWKNYAKNYFLSDYYDENIEKMINNHVPNFEIIQYVENKVNDILFIFQQKKQKFTP